LFDASSGSLGMDMVAGEAEHKPLGGLVVDGMRFPVHPREILEACSRVSHVDPRIAGSKDNLSVRKHPDAVALQRPVASTEKSQ
jgi:hypothetical protein